MSALKIHLDEDADSRALLSALRQRGVDVTSTGEQGLSRTTDDAQLAWAAQAGRSIFTYNASDYCRLHRAWQQRGLHHAGIIVGDQ